MPSPTSQRELQGPASLLTPQGDLGQAGWSRHPLLDCNLEMELTPFKERLARTNLVLITSEVHQMFGRYRGRLITDDGETVSVEGLAGFSEEHRARW